MSSRLMSHIAFAAIAVLGAFAFAGIALNRDEPVSAAWLVTAAVTLATLLFLAPDLAMLGYLRSPRFGALIYNLGHTYAAPALLALAGLALGPPAYGLAAIWAAHIGFDRLLGYGLKLGTGFEQTHLGPIGKARR